MSDVPQSSAPVPAGSPYRELQFDGDQLVTVLLDGEGIAVPVRLICQALGIDVASQSERIQSHEVLSRGLRVVRVRQGQQLRSVAALLHRYIPFWLATISPHQVREDVRPKLVRYQTELVDILVAALQQTLARALTDLRIAREALLALQQQQDVQGQHLAQQQQHLADHDVQIARVEGVMDDVLGRIAQHPVTAPQQEAIGRAIRTLAVRYKQRTGTEIFGRLFGQFCMHFGTPKYSLQPSARYAEAMAWVRAQAENLLPDDPDAVPSMQEALL
jgi:hypothetical protein